MKVARITLVSPGSSSVLCDIAGRVERCARKVENEPVEEAVLWLVHFKLGVNTGTFEQS